MPVATRLPLSLLEAASRSYGVLSRAQVVAVLTPGQLRALVARGDLAVVARGVYRLPGSGTSFRQRAAAAACAYGPDATISHRSAEVLWLDDAQPRLPPAGSAIEVTLPRGRSGRRDGTRVHHADLAADERTVRHGLVVTTPIRTLADLARTTSAGRLAATADALVGSQALRPADLADGIARYSAGWHGRDRLVRATAAHLEGVEAVGTAEDAARLRSVREEEVRRWLVEGGLPAPVRQHPVTLDRRTVHLDLAYPASKVAIEFDSWRWHGSRHAFDRDRRRWADLQLAGWVVVTVTSAQGREEVVRRVRRALDLQAARVR